MVNLRFEAQYRLHAKIAQYNQLLNACHALAFACGRWHSLTLLLVPREGLKLLMKERASITR
jgi:hypothetical protein